MDFILLPSSLLITLLLFLFGVVSFILYFKYTYTYWSEQNIVFAPPVIPFGNYAPYVFQKRSVGQQTNHLYNEFKRAGKKYGGIYMLAKPILLVLDPDVIRSVLSKDFQYFNSRGTYCDEVNDPLTANLVNLNGYEWKNMRSKLTPTFSSGKMKMMFQILVECSKELDTILHGYCKKNEAIDIKDILGRFTTDIIGSCAFGIDCNSLKEPDNKFRRYGKRIFEPTFWDTIKGMISSQYPKFFSALKLKRVPTEANDFFMDVIKNTVQYRETTEYHRKDFMQLLIEMKNNNLIDNNGTHEEQHDNMSLTMNQLAAQAFVFFLAGFETSSNTLSTVMYELSIHQDIQDKLRNEIRDILKKYDGKITYEGINETFYMDKVIDETMRLHSAVPLLVRKCSKDCYITGSNIIIRKDIPIFIPVDALHRDPEYYPDPEKFDPERFSLEEKAKRHPYIFLPFGAGPRNCIGLRFAMMQMKVGLLALLKDYKFTLNSRTKLPITLDPKSILYSIQGGVWINAHKV